MDPEATYRELLDAITNGDRDAAEQSASDLAGWLAAEGFPPVVDQRLAGVSRLQVVLAMSLCRAVLEPSFLSSLYLGVCDDNDAQ